MRINPISKFEILPQSQNFKGNSEVFAPVPMEAPPQAPLNTAKAYALPQINNTGYREVETFEIKNVGKGKLYELSNGHKVIIIPKPGPTAINTAVGVGYLNEPANLKQESHLLEHLIDNNCYKPNDKEVEDTLQKTGAVCNAGTTLNYTNYYMKAPISDSKDLEDLIKVQAKTLTHTTFTEQDVEDEKKIVTQELNSKNYFARNVANLNKYTFENLFNLDENSDSIGLPSYETIKNIKKSDLINHYNNFYRPDNMVTTIVGAVDDNTIKTVAKHIGQIENPKKSEENTNIVELSTKAPIQKSARKDFLSLDKNTSMAAVTLSFLGPENVNSDDNNKMFVLKHIIQNRISDNNKGKDDGMLFFVYSNSISTKESDPNIIYFNGFCDNFNVEKDLKELYAVINDVNVNPVKEEELAKVKDEINTAIYEPSATNIADDMSIMGLTHEDLDDAKGLQLINQITVKDIQDVAKKYLDLNKASIVVAHPYKTPFDKVKKVNETDAVSFKGNIDQLNSKDIHEYVLPNNLRLVVDTRPGNLKSCVKLEMHSQKRLYANQNIAVALPILLASKETEKKLSKGDILYSSEGSTQNFSINMSSDPKKTMEMLKSSVGIILHPDFSSESFNRIKSKVFVDKKPNQNTSIKDRVIDEIFNESPYSYFDEEGKDVEIGDVELLYKQIMNNAQGTVFITMPKAEYNEHKNEIFETLEQLPDLKPYSYKNIFDKVDFNPLEKNKVFIKENDNDTQLNIEQAFKIIESGNIKDKAGLLILNEIIGGPEKSLLLKHLREEDKISYSANSYYVHEQYINKASIYGLATEVTASDENLKKVIDEYKRSINELITGPIDNKILENAKVKVKNSQIYQMESTSSKNNYISDKYNSFYGASYQDALFTAIDEMTPEYIQALAKHYLTQPSIIAIEGNKKVIEQNKDYLAKLGEITDCD